MDGTRTADTIEEMASQLEAAARDMRKQAAELRETNNFDIVVDTICTVRGIFQTIRLDLLWVRPMREYKRQATASEAQGT